MSAPAFFTLLGAEAGLFGREEGRIPCRHHLLKVALATLILMIEALLCAISLDCSGTFHLRLGSRRLEFVQRVAHVGLLLGGEEVFI